MRVSLDLRMSVFKDFIIENNVTFRQCGPVSCMSLILKLGNPNDFMDINYKCLLKELKLAVSTKAVEKKPIEKSVGSNKGGISGDFLARLERKWCGYGKPRPLTDFLTHIDLLFRTQKVIMKQMKIMMAMHLWKTVTVVAMLKARTIITGMHQ